MSLDAQPNIIYGAIAAVRMPRAVLVGLERKVERALDGLTDHQRDIVERELWLAVRDVVAKQGTRGALALLKRRWPS